MTLVHGVLTMLRMKDNVLTLGQRGEGTNLYMRYN